MKPTSITVLLLLAACGSDHVAPPGDDSELPDATPPADAAADFVHDPGLEGAPFALTDPSCTETTDRINCSGVIYSELDDVVGHRQLHIDLHVPLAAKTQRVPAILWLHPGGWSVGKYQAITQIPVDSYIARGYAVLTAEYRLTLNADKSISGIKFPDNLIDTKTAVRWMRIKGRDFIDPDRLLAYGISAGAHLATMIGTTPGVAAFDGRGDPSVPTSVKAVVGVSPPIDFHQFVPLNPPLADSCPSQPPGQDPQDGVSWLAGATQIGDVPFDTLTSLGAVSYLAPSSPPMLLFAGTCDQTVPYQSTDVSVRQRAQELGMTQIEIFIAQDAFHNTTLESPAAQSKLEAFVTAQLDP